MYNLICIHPLITAIIAAVAIILFVDGRCAKFKCYAHDFGYSAVLYTSGMLISFVAGVCGVTKPLRSSDEHLNTATNILPTSPTSPSTCVQAATNILPTSPTSPTAVPSIPIPHLSRTTTPSLSVSPVAHVMHNLPVQLFCAHCGTKLDGEKFCSVSRCEEILIWLALLLLYTHI